MILDNSEREIYHKVVSAGSLFDDDNALYDIDDPSMKTR